MSRRLEDLQPGVMFRAMHALAALDDKDIPYIVTSTLRTTDEQVAFYAQGRQPLDAVNILRVKAHMRPISEAENAATVTRADGVTYKSNHQGGRALDVVPREGGNPKWPPASDPRWEQIADVMKEAGFYWGGDWVSFPDSPHYEII